MIKVTKLNAASRQLDTAIKLWAADDDPVSIHSLAFAAHQIVHDLNRTESGEPLIMDSPLVPDDRRRDFVNAVKRFSNFFKHADNWGKKKKDWDPAACGGVLYLRQIPTICVK